MSLTQHLSSEQSPCSDRSWKNQALTLWLYHHPPDVASSHSPRQLTTSSMFQLGKGRVSPSLCGHNLKGMRTPPPRHLSGQDVFTWSPQVQGKLGMPCAHLERQYKERRRNGHWGTDSLQSVIPGQGVAFPENDPRNAKRKRGPITHTFHGPKSEQCCILCFILSCPCVCGGFEGGTLKAPRSLEGMPQGFLNLFYHKAIWEG